MANNISEGSAKPRQLMLLEEFKGCLPAEIKTHLDERKQRTCTNVQFGQMTMHSLVRMHYSLGMLKLQKRLLEKPN